MLKKIIFYIMVFCMMIPQTVHAKAQTNTQLEILTDHSRQIVIEQINGDELYTATIDQKGYQSLSYNEPGNYEYKIYESKSSANRDSKEYIATVCVLIDEKTGEFQTPIVAIDYADGSGKPQKITFGNFTKESSTESTAKQTSTTSTKQKQQVTANKKPTPKINPITAIVKTGDDSPLILYLVLFSLSMTGFLFISRRRNNEEF